MCASLSTTMGPGQLSIPVPGRRVDALVEELGWYPDLVKIDVEGAELRALAGMPDLLTRRPTLFLELHGSCAESTGPEITRWLIGLGYRLTALNRSNSRYHRRVRGPSDLPDFLPVLFAEPGLDC